MFASVKAPNHTYTMHSAGKQPGHETEFGSMPLWHEISARGSTVRRDPLSCANISTSPLPYISYRERIFYFYTKLDRKYISYIISYEDRYSLQTS